MSSAVISVHGNIGNVQDVRTLDSGAQVLNFSLAHNPYSPTGEEKTDWYEVALWNDFATKGFGKLLADKRVKSALIVGELETETYQYNGETRFKLKITRVYRADVTAWKDGEGAAANDPSADVPF